MSSQTLESKIKKNTDSYCEEIIKKLKKHSSSNAFVHFTFDENRIRERIRALAKSSSTGSLFGYVCCIKDLISNTDSFVSGGSKFLQDYKPPFNSSVYLALQEAGVVNVANASLDEFGMGGTGVHGHTGPVQNPFSSEHIVGGSSSGSAYLVRQGIVDFSVVSDTGDSARYPASNCHIFGFKPSYGAISRYGFYPFCSGFDTPSIMASTLPMVAEVFSVISFRDPKDLCTLKTVKKDYVSCLRKSFDKHIKIAVIKDTFWSKEDRSKENYEIEKKFDDLLENLREKLKVEVEIYDFPQQILRLANLVYMIVSYSESISNHANLTGLLFPFSKTKNGEVRVHRKDIDNNYSGILTKNRSILGEEFVFRQLMGMNFLEGENYEKLYIQSKKLLSMINKEVDELFKTYDLIISPSADGIPPKIKEYKRSYSPSNIRNIMLLANFCSLPAISMPWTFIDDMPIGLHLMASFGEDEFLLNMSNHICNLLNKK